MLHRRDENRASTFPERCQPYIMTAMRAINRISVLKMRDFLIIYGSESGEGHAMATALVVKNPGPKAIFSALGPIYSNPIMFA